MEMDKGQGKWNTIENEDEDVSKRLNYEKRLTVLVEIVGEDRITMMQLLKKVREECGVVISCRYKNPREYELTMNEEKGKVKILDGLKIKNSRIMAKEISNNEMVVSFLNLPTYIQDKEIIGKLTDWRVTAVSTIKRRMWPGTDIADGTRFCACNISEERKEDESVGSSVDLYEEVEEVLTAEEEEREDTWSERDITAGQRTGERDDVDSNQEGMESFKDGNGRNLREQITEEEDGGTTKSGDKSEGGDRKKNQGTNLHEEESFKEKEEQTVVLETPLINLKEEMDTSEGSFKLRKMKGDEESIATK